jgi:hypothetical protein
MKVLLATLALSVLPVVTKAQDAPKFMTDVSPQASAGLSLGRRHWSKR